MGSYGGNPRSSVFGIGIQGRQYIERLTNEIAHAVRRCPADTSSCTDEGSTQDLKVFAIPFRNHNARWWSSPKLRITRTGS